MSKQIHRSARLSRQVRVPKAVEISRSLVSEPLAPPPYEAIREALVRHDCKIKECE